MPHLRQSYEDLTAAVQGADLLVTHPITFAGPLVAAKTGLPWVSSVLAPLSLQSNDDPPVLAPLPPLLRQPAINRFITRLSRFAIRSWSDPVHALRAELGLPPGADPIFEGQHSPDLVLALFSLALAAPQADWPRNTRATGFPFYDQPEKRAGLPAELERFLDSGDAPIVFTLGSSAVMAARDFYVESAQAAERIGRRAVLLTGRGVANTLPTPLPAGVIAADYAPYSAILPRTAAIVHQGGVGTTAEAMRAGRPMLVVPFAHDQHDNAARVVRLGVAREIGRGQYRADRVAASLRRLVETPGYRERAEQVGCQIRAENGASAACDLIERRLGVATIAVGNL
jgi:UDP:flavonoid glycosyltransferase YjiC (YdhE family)